MDQLQDLLAVQTQSSQHWTTYLLQILDLLPLRLDLGLERLHSHTLLNVHELLITAAACLLGDHGGALLVILAQRELDICIHLGRVCRVIRPPRLTTLAAFVQLTRY